jgi:signal transduction histidine kinase
MRGAMLARALRSPAFATWLPVAVLAPVMVLDAARQGTEVTALGVVGAVVGCLPLVLRGRVPFVVLAPLLSAGIVVVLWTLDVGDTVVLIPIVALIDLAERGTRRRSAWIALAVLPCVIVSVLPFADDPLDLVAIVARNYAFCLLALAGGDILRARREEERQRTAARLGEQRLRIAQEVHDVVAHAMVAINVQAGVAAHLLDRDPQQARSALREIKAASGDALTELRQTLGVLREPESEAPLAPTHTLGDLDELAAGLRAVGVDVELRVGELPRIPAAVQAAGYRIVQEALTNVLRHARASCVRVDVDAPGGDEVRIEVVDDGRGANGAGPGNGTRGMRERAAALHGTLDAGPGEDGGWRVRARLPIGAA